MIRAIRHDVPLVVSKARALDEAYKVVGKQGRVIRDGVGRIAYDMGDYILVAKTYGIGIVSCHKSLLSMGKPIVMYLQDSKRFYRFDLQNIKEEIERNPNKYVNRRGHFMMQNFPLGLGTRWEPGQVDVPKQEKFF